MPAPSCEIFVVTGPTASGKSAVAMALGRKIRGIVINADSMQMYRDIPIITAQPSPDERLALPHALYGVMDAAERGTAASWMRQATAEIDNALASGVRPILTGGTGFYLKSLMRGLSPMPEVSENILAALNQELATNGLPSLRAELATTDPEAERKITAGDTQRILRALAVWRASGRRFSDWQSVPPGSESKKWMFRLLILMPPRARLYEKINLRFKSMIAAGACEEVARMALRRLDPSLPAMRAHGVPELLAYGRNDTTLEQAIAHAQQATRNYAKRQETWIRHQWLAPEACSDLNFVAPAIVLSDFVESGQENQVADSFCSSV